MSNQMFTDLPAAINANFSDIICAVQGYVSSANLGISTQATLQQVFALFNSNMVLQGSGNPNGAVAGISSQLYFDTLNQNLWVCITTGTALTAVWVKSVKLNAGSGITITQSGATFTISSSSPGVPGSTSLVTSGTTTVLTSASTQQILYSGTLSQTVQMPDVTTITQGQTFRIVNDSSNAIFVNSFGSDAIVTLQPFVQCVLTVILPTGTTAASWDVQQTSNLLGVISLTGTANQVIFSSSTGNIVASLPQSIGTTSSPTFAGLSLTAALTVANGGTGKASFTAFAPAVGGTTTTGALQSVTLGVSGTLFQSSGTAALPGFTTATYPTTTTINQILFSSAANTLTGLTTANSAALVTSSAGVPSFSGSMTNGQVIIGSTGGTPTPAILTAGSGVSIVNAAGSITISSTGSLTAATQADQEAATSTVTYVSPGRQQFHPSASKAWLYSLYSAGVPLLSASYNIASITDNGVGDATVNLSTVFSSANYCVTSGLNIANNSVATFIPTTYSVAAGNFRLSFVSAGGSSTDPFAFHTACFGDQP